MRAKRTLPLLCILLLVGGVLGGCSRGPSEEEQKLAGLQEQFASIQQLNDTLQQARADLAAAETTVADIEAIDERKRSDEQKAQLEELTAQIEELTATQDTTFEELSANLAEFLNVALNEFPDIPETSQALAVYSEEAILVSNDMVAKAGDYKKATDHLYSAASLYEQIGLEIYAPLNDRIAYLEDWRFITQERFDAVKKNMTKEQVMELAGVPYYQNIKVDEKRGVEMWLYRKRDGGAAAISFRTKNNKVYHKNFDAVKTRVAE
jgi:hypothetical protein